MTDTPVIDQDALDRLTQWGGERLLHQMVRLFLENSPERLDQIRAGFEQDDIRQVERGSHSLKSSAANVGARQLNRLAQQMEDATVDGDLERARDLHAPLIEAHAAACERLREVQTGASE